MEGWHHAPPLLLNVRTVNEWNVNHLPDAHRVDLCSPTEAALPNVSKDDPVITYCAVGYCSAEMAIRLGAAGFTHVPNLKGAIFSMGKRASPLLARK